MYFFLFEFFFSVKKLNLKFFFPLGLPSGFPLGPGSALGLPSGSPLGSGSALDSTLGSPSGSGSTLGLANLNEFQIFFEVRRTSNLKDLVQRTL